MSRGKRGNREAKKPKAVKPAVAMPVTATGTPVVPTGFKPMPAKK